MSTSGHSSLRSAFLGLAITGAFVSYQLLTDQGPIARSSALMLTFLILCPPSILSITTTATEVGTNNFYILWTVIGVLNAVLYGGIRAVVAWRQRTPN